jgi:hypothetical protein
MSHLIQSRDRQSAKTQAWHGLTTIVDDVNQSSAFGWDVVETPILYRVPNPEQPGQEKIIEHPKYMQLVANDDYLPIGEPYNKDTYTPSSIKMLWEIVRLGMGDTPHTIESAGSVDDRRKTFISLKVSDGFTIGDREFKDYITLLDSFDKSCSLTCLYSSICVVCANTYGAAMRTGKEVGKAKHTKMIDLNVQRLIDAIDAFSGTSAHFKGLMQEAFVTPCSRDEARAWLTGIEGRNMDRPTNGLLQKSARMADLFERGKGNEGRTRLDAFSALTDFHSHESSNRKGEDAQYMSSEFGASAVIKTLAASRFKEDWEKNTRHGNALLEQDRVALTN